MRYGAGVISFYESRRGGNDPRTNSSERELLQGSSVGRLIEGLIVRLILLLSCRKLMHRL